LSAQGEDPEGAPDGTAQYAAAGQQNPEYQKHAAQELHRLFKQFLLLARLTGLLLYYSVSYR